VNGTPIPVKSSHRLSAALALPLTVVMLSGCGFFGPETFGAEDRSIEVDAGDTFELTLPANPSTGQDWSIVRPGPDRATVRQEGGREDDFKGDSGADGGGDGTQTFSFQAVAAGTTEIKMSYCVLGQCPDGDGRPATGSPGSDPAYFIYTVTVR
jgi:predicted secreted protein